MGHATVGPRSLTVFKTEKWEYSISSENVVFSSPVSKFVTMTLPFSTRRSSDWPRGFTLTSSAPTAGIRNSSMLRSGSKTLWICPMRHCSWQDDCSLVTLSRTYMSATSSDARICSMSSMCLTTLATRGSMIPCIDQS